MVLVLLSVCDRLEDGAMKYLKMKEQLNLLQ